MKTLGYIFLFFTFLISHQSFADSKSFQAQKIKKSPQIDGRFNEEAWKKSDWINDFTQRSPYEGKEPSELTKFKILYDNDYLYVGIRSFDSQPDKIVKRLSRRDNLEGDYVSVQIDSYNDKRTAFVFSVTAAGVKEDMVISDDGNNNNINWDPIWYVETQIDDKGWTAEMKIPFTQLRFSKKGEQSWGFEIIRSIYRHQESVMWKLIPKDAGGWVSQFGQLKGMNNIKPQKEKSITPYTVAKLEKFEKVAENPFKSSGSNSNINAGFNGKFGVTNNLTLDLAINPDFGQVEADPSQVNLSAYETFFEEKRPFFIEGSNIMNFRLMVFGNFMSDNLFYSRRIGRTPHYYPDAEDDEYVKTPDNTNILSALKLTGKTKSGWSVGVLESVTGKETATISDGNDNFQQTVEPLTNYFLGRVQKDFNEGNTMLGGIFTATNRKINHDHLDFLHDQAYTGGFNFQHQWKDKTYMLAIRGIFSHVRGDNEAIIQTQRSSARYYQRPNTPHTKLDSSRNSLTGHGGSLMFGKMGNGKINYMLFVNYKSPGLELNDMGYQRKADEISQLGWIQYGFREPFSIFKNLFISSNQWIAWDYAGTNLVKGGNVQMSMNFKNHWDFHYGVNVNSVTLDRTALRGGQYFKEPASLNYWVNLGTDPRKPVQIDLWGNQSWRKFDYEKSKNIGVNFTFRPHNTLDVSISPSYSTSNKEIQYIDTKELTNDTKYLMGTINQTTFGLSLRINFSILPDLSIQYWGQPFIASGNYSDFKYITDPLAENYYDRFEVYHGSQVNYKNEDEIYEIDENYDGSVDYSFDNPDFNVLQFRSNLVARWEYMPGSTLYLVWSQNRDDYLHSGNFVLNRDLNALGNTYPHNIFLVKLTYRFGL